MSEPKTMEKGASVCVLIAPGTEGVQMGGLPKMSSFCSVRPSQGSNSESDEDI